MRHHQSAPGSPLNTIVALIMLPIRLMVWLLVIVLMAVFSLD